MSRRLTSRLSLPWLLSLCVLVGLSAPVTAGATSSAGCENRVNDTSRKLVPCITTDDLWNHMKAFQAIADANPGPDGHPSRNSGEPGYKASVDYVAKLMKQAGYDVTIQPYTFTYTALRRDAELERGLPVCAQLHPGQRLEPGDEQWGRDRRSDQPAGGIVLPPTPTSSSASGCTAADFNGSFAGKIALIQRGGCNFGVKVLNAEAAGAAGVVIFNEGNPGRTAVISGSLLDADNNPFVPNVPVAFTSFATGQSLYTEYQAGTPPVMNLEHPRGRRPEPRPTGTSSRSPRAAIRTMSWSSMRTWTRSTVPACWTTPPAR